ncbi:MAG: isoaspartyl peptidase/L-asparaginase [Verrucomicrobiaceae bacterium]|nr:isoaspartyl peptidase/L-asparaginase [Verrucomicrobiaceae bacterium]
MKSTLIALILITGCLWAGTPITLVLHGGAGAERKKLSPEKEAACRAVLNEALHKGYDILKQGGSSEQAVISSIMVLEDSPLFNAGRGAALTRDGIVELDASLMVGHSGLAGAVANVHGVRNPILLAQKVMLRTPHVLMIGEGAENLARQEKLEFEAPEWFITPEQKERLERAKKKDLPKGAYIPVPGRDSSLLMGTVGAVALDKNGNLAAGTSTGGLAGKLPGRVGDSPVIGAGTYAENGVCAVSCTGHGEFFIRNAVAYDVAARMKYANATLKDATHTIINDKLKKLDARGGLIAVDAKGNVSTPFNSEGMFHARMGPDGVAYIAVFEE